MNCGLGNEQVIEARHTGLNKRAGDLIHIKFQYMPAVIAGGEFNRIADRMHIVQHSDHSLEFTIQA